MFGSALTIQTGVVFEYAGVVFVAFALQGMAMAANVTTSAQRLSICIALHWGTIRTEVLFLTRTQD